MENRNGLAVGGMVTQADGTAERRASEAMLKSKPKAQSASPSARTKHTTPTIIAALRRIDVTPHVAQNDSLTKTGKRRKGAIDARTTRHIGYQISDLPQNGECIFGWGKQHGTIRKTKHRGTAAVAAGTSYSISSPTISCASPSSSPPQAESARKPENRLRQTENPTTRTETGRLPQVFQQIAGSICLSVKRGELLGELFRSKPMSSLLLQHWNKQDTVRTPPSSTAPLSLLHPELFTTYSYVRSPRSVIVNN